MSADSAGEPGRRDDADLPGPGEQPEGPGALRQELLVTAGNLAYDRVLFFSDAVFAIAITLLVVDLVSNHPGSAPAGNQLRAAAPAIFGFALSFAVIGIFWLAHHAICRYIAGFDRPLILLNLLFLGTIAFLPFPTALISGQGSEAASTVFYAACCAIAGLAETAFWLYATRPGGTLATPEARGARGYYLARMLRAPVVFVLSIPIALVVPLDGKLFWVLMMPAGILIRRFVPMRPGSVPADRTD